MKTPCDFSVVIATYTGISTIKATFESLLQQKAPGSKFEIVVVIDGPNTEILEKVKRAEERFKSKKIDFRVEQFQKNKGRFEARLAGAKLARYPYILIVDDRIQIPTNFFKATSTSGEEALMPDVQEKPAKNFVSFTMNHLRRRLYGERWNKDFKPYYIDQHNFDKSPKGTTAFWVNRNKFIEACDFIAKRSSDTKNVNEDTRILRYLVDNGVKILKTSKVRLEYEPRASAREELLHIYHRGPRFIDYYFKPGTRYFMPLMLFYLSLIPVLLLVIFVPAILLVALLASFIVSLWVGSRPTDWLRILAGAWAVLLFFGAGLLKGLIIKVAAR